MKELSKKNMCIICGIISIILGFIYHVACNYFGIYTNFVADRIIIAAAISMFVGLHVIIGFKKLYDFIIEKRYIIALICLIVFTILGYTGSSIGAISSWILEKENNNTILGTYRTIHSNEYAVEALMASMQKNYGMNYFSLLSRAVKTDIFSTTHAPVLDMLTLCREYNLGYFFLNFDMAFSFAWNFKLIALLLITFEFFQILTNKKKYLSLVGSILISFSSFIAWHFEPDVLIFGELALIAIDNFMRTDNVKIKFGISIVLVYAIISYIFSFNIAWMISFGYVFLAIFIWIVLKNAKEYKFRKIDLICIVLLIGIVAIFLGRFYVLSQDSIKAMFNTSYAEERNVTGGKGISYLFSYAYSFLLPFVETENNMLYAGMLSLFPIPLIMGMIYIYKKEKHIDFILPMLIVLVVESIWCMTGFPKVLGKISLLNMVPVEKCAVAVALGSIYLYMYMISNIEEKFISLKDSVKVVLIILVLFFCIDRPEILQATKGQMYFFAAILTMAYFLSVNSLDKKYTKLFLGYIVIWTLVGSIFVNPITKGTSVITDTNLANAIKTEIKKAPDEMWITENMDMVVSNYLVANGAKTLNSTNFYPNEKFWKTILEEEFEEKRDIWARYAHIRIKLTEDNTSIFLDSEDKIVVNLNYAKLAELGIKYIVSYKEEALLEKGKIDIIKVYENKIDEPINIESELVDGIYIYEIVN